MLANRVQETTTTTGTGNLTLAGASTNFQTFNNAFGLNRRFHYWIVDDTNDVWECGIGYLSATTTLVRSIVTDNSSDTTSALNLSAGTKEVFCAKTADCAYGSPYEVNDDATNQFVFPTMGHQEDASVGGAGGQNDVNYCPYYLTIGGLFSGASIHVNTSAVSAECRIGIYSLVTGRPDSRLEQTGAIDCSTTGLKTGTFSGNIFLNPGWWYVAFIYSQAPLFAAYQQDSIGASGMAGFGSGDLESHVNALIEGGTGITLPTTAATSGLTNDQESMPAIGLITV